MIIPPIKSQGIKTKIVPSINKLIDAASVPFTGDWYEPFFGTGVVGFNSPIRGRKIVGDTNPHIIAFYNAVLNGDIDEHKMRVYLEDANLKLSAAADDGYAYYREVRDRFNAEHDPFDFIFLSRAGFNGMIRFNGKGKWNIPFCKKKDRFAQAYVTKICNQVKQVRTKITNEEWEFNNVSFENTICRAGANDLIYSDSPYFGRYADYYNTWTEEDEVRLCELLTNSPARFILSTWHHNQYRENPLIDKLWCRFNILTQEHFYFSGGKLENRNSMVEALVYNFDIDESRLREEKETSPNCEGEQLLLFD